MTLGTEQRLKQKLLLKLLTTPLPEKILLENCLWHVVFYTKKLIKHYQDKGEQAELWTKFHQKNCLHDSRVVCNHRFSSARGPFYGLSQNPRFKYESADDYSSNSILIHFIRLYLLLSNLSSALERKIAANWQYNWGINTTYMISKGNKRWSDELSNQKITNWCVRMNYLTKLRRPISISKVASVHWNVFDGSPPLAQV